MAQTHGAERGLSRLEGFSDAVFAIALTLLIVEIKPPGSPEGPAASDGLFAAIAEQWRDFLALLICFLSIGVYWLQHHYSGSVYAKSDYAFSLINLGFLLAVTALPYPLRVWCFYLGTEHETEAAIALTVGMLLPGLLWLGKWFYALPAGRLIDERLDPRFLRSLTRRYVISVGLQALAVPIAFVAPRLAAVLTFAVVLFYMYPPPKPSYRPGHEQPPEDR
jgi:uncharacterized membrane protein